MILSNNPALIVIDVQDGIKEEIHWGGNRNNPEAENNIEMLLRHWRKLSLPVVIVQHCSVSPESPFRPGYPGNKLMDFITEYPHEQLIKKTTANTFVKTDLLEYLENKKVTSLVVSGFVTNNSVEATARYAGDLGFNTTVVSDATACFDKITMNGIKYPADVVHQLSLANLKDEYASIRTTKEIIQST